MGAIDVVDCPRPPNPTAVCSQDPKLGRPGLGVLSSVETMLARCRKGNNALMLAAGMSIQIARQLPARAAAG